MNGRSDESLDSSGGDITSSTVQPQVYYGDESDEGLVKQFFFIRISRKKYYFVYRIVCHQLIQLYLIIIIVCHMIVMIKMVINHFFKNLFEKIVFFF
jgi:t-SNARE complex subunit (syntaxin)